MKKTCLTITLVSICVFLISFIPKEKTEVNDVNSNWKAKTTENLYNSEYEISMTLYSNGYVSLKSAAGPASGMYDIDNENWITFNWEEGSPERGFVTTVQTTSGKRIKSVTVKGVTLNNTERFVVNRR